MASKKEDIKEWVIGNYSLGKLAHSHHPIKKGKLLEKVPLEKSN